MHRLHLLHLRKMLLWLPEEAFGLVEDSCGTHMAPVSGGSNRNRSHNPVLSYLQQCRRASRSSSLGSQNCFQSLEKEEKGSRGGELHGDGAGCLLPTLSRHNRCRSSAPTLLQSISPLLIVFPFLKSVGPCLLSSPFLTACWNLPYLPMSITLPLLNCILPPHEWEQIKLLYLDHLCSKMQFACVAAGPWANSVLDTFITLQSNLLNISDPLALKENVGLRQFFFFKSSCVFMHAQTHSDIHVLIYVYICMYLYNK